MYQTIRTALRRSQPTLVQDMLGATALVVILVGALHLPVL
ncbi:hypothetical protein Salmuc_00723 [Salipiger mucosus DSM 16094]|uniref:Uncharacterized protein n=1 Tax=Salipiger mucosus DSM 16094 TaxID=1123237 RepID=S9RD77_9RHOB|nr:hypothetical protein Salmuc_00723 [Salipiger mucosus DSM 16094]